MTIVILDASSSRRFYLKPPVSMLFILSNLLVVYFSREVEGYFEEGGTIQYGIEMQTERFMAKIQLKSRVLIGLRN
jgi:hypothetical protein